MSLSSTLDSINQHLDLAFEKVRHHLPEYSRFKIEPYEIKEWQAMASQYETRNKKTFNPNLPEKRGQKRIQSVATQTSDDDCNGNCNGCCDCNGCSESECKTPFPTPKEEMGRRLGEPTGVVLGGVSAGLMTCGPSEQQDEKHCTRQRCGSEMGGSEAKKD
jgi:hypothetical protein